MRFVWIALSLPFMLASSGCNYWPGLPDVSILKTHYPVVHYIPLAPLPTKKGKAASDGKSAERPRETYITFEKARPASWVGIDEISKAAVGAIVVSEDWAFYQHKGYDPNQIREALKDDLAEGKFARGASTITQQVAKNVFLNADKNMVRKLKEFFLAVKLEEKLRKPKILEVYLNIAEWGQGIYGIGPAARTYFNKTPRELTAKEGAFLAMLLPSPKRYSQSFRAKRLTDYASSTVEDILGKMVQAHYLSEEERALQLATPLIFEVL